MNTTNSTKTAKSDVLRRRFSFDKSPSVATSKPNPSHRIEEIFASLVRETWLPMGLRSTLAEELANLLSEANQPRPNWSDLAHKTNAITLFAYSYGETVIDSETVTQIRILELEFEGYRSDNSSGPTQDSSWIGHDSQFDIAN